MTNEKHEEILEAIWSTSEKGNHSVDAIRKRCDVHFTEDDLQELVELGLITRQQPDSVLFSDKGKVLAEGAIRRHRLAEVLVSSILMLRNSQMEETACKIEHNLIPEVEESICTLLGHPEVCPDGKPIPNGSCCDRGLKVIDRTVVSLIDLKPGESGKISYIKPITHSNFHQLISFGLHPGVVVSVHRANPAFCIKFGNTELALDEDIVRNIFVWRLNPAAD